MEGERDKALKWLRRAIKLGNENKPWFERDKNWDSLRSDPEYLALIAALPDPVQSSE
jgi:hypothetical protein